MQFFLVNTKVDIVNTLEGTSYHQGTWTVEDFLDSFQSLVSDIRYPNLQTLIVKFYQELRIDIQNQIATIPYKYL